MLRRHLPPLRLRTGSRPRSLVAAPFSPLQPLLHRIVRKVARQRPELFDRLGPHRHSRFLIDARELPFALLLVPDPEKPHLRAHSRSSLPVSDVRIAGPCRELVKMADGSIDGDALFFSRDLSITGNLEAAVCLRNALDDLDGSIMDDVLGAFGVPGRFVRPLLRPFGLAGNAGRATA